MIEPDSSSTATFETHASIIARNKSSGEPAASGLTDVCLVAPESIAGVHFPCGLKPQPLRGSSLLTTNRFRFTVCISAKSRSLSSRCFARLTQLSHLSELQSHSTQDNCSNLFRFPIRSRATSNSHLPRRDKNQNHGSLSHS